MSKKFEGFVAGFIVLMVSYKVIEVIVSIILALGLGAVGIHISESARALANVQATATILGAIGGAYLAQRIYKYITKNIEQKSAENLNKSSK